MSLPACRVTKTNKQNHLRLETKKCHRDRCHWSLPTTTQAHTLLTGVALGGERSTVERETAVLSPAPSPSTTPPLPRSKRGLWTNAAKGERDGSEGREREGGKKERGQEETDAEWVNERIQRKQGVKKVPWNERCPRAVLPLALCSCSRLFSSCASNAFGVFKLLYFLESFRFFVSWVVSRSNLCVHEPMQYRVLMYCTKSLNFFFFFNKI